MMRLTVVLFLSFLLCAVNGAKILGIFPFLAPSHLILGNRLMTELASRGHQVTMITAQENMASFANFRHVETIGVGKKMKEMMEARNLFEMTNMPNFLFIPLLHNSLLQISEDFLSNEEVQKLLKSNETFDLLILEQFSTESLQGIGYHFKVPIIAFSTIGATPWVNRLVSNPYLPSYLPQVMLNYKSNMNFFQRVHNSILTLGQELYELYYVYPKHNALLHKYIPDAPHLDDLIYNTSLVLLNSHVSSNEPFPLVPNMIEIGGFHVHPLKKLPEDLQQLLDDAKEGAIYFSLGSNAKSKDMPIEKRQVILNVFSRLKFKVFWKWENDDLPGKPSNVEVRKWMPQQEILAHKNIKLFITHGGLLSTIETVHYGVPIVGIPIMADQKMNMENAVSNGYGITLNFNELSEENFEAAIKEVLYNPKYAENMKKRSRIMNDQQVKPIDKAVYWVEYVIRHKGADHLKTAVRNLTWYQYFLLDVILFLVVTSFVLFKLVVYVVKRLCSNKSSKKIKTK